MPTGNVNFIISKERNLYVFSLQDVLGNINICNGYLSQIKNIIITCFLSFALVFFGRSGDSLSREMLVKFLAHLVMGLCNHALSIMCHCQCHQHHMHQHLCTAIPVTALIIETSYLIDICTYAPSLCTWNIKSMWHVFFKCQPF